MKKTLNSINEQNESDMNAKENQQSSPIFDSNRSKDIKPKETKDALSQTISTDFFEMDGDSFTFKVDTPEYLEKFLSLFGTKSEPMACDVTAQFIQTVSPSGNIKPEHTPKLNAMMAMMEGISPKNEHEALIGSQMVVTHNLGMEFLARASNPLQNSEGVDQNLSRGLKLMKMFTAQTIALNKLRNNQQKMTVEHIHINEGGQAIVGNVNVEGGGKKK